MWYTNDVASTALTHGLLPARTNNKCGDSNDTHMANKTAGKAKATKATLNAKEFNESLTPLAEFVNGKTHKVGEERLLNEKQITDQECFAWILNIGKSLPALMKTIKAAAQQAKAEGDGKLIKGVTSVIASKKKSKAPKINVSKVRKVALAEMKTVRNIVTASSILTPYIKGKTK
jgi:hypothetical protein